MGLSVGSVVYVQYSGRMFNQTIINGFHYATGTADPTTSLLDDLQGVVDYFNSATIGDPLIPYLGCMPENYFLGRVSAQQVYPVRSRVVAAFTDQQGTRPTANTANQAAVVTYQTDLGGRDQISSNHFPMSDQDSVAGLVQAGLKTNIDLFAEIRRTFFSPVGSQASLNPCIYHRGPNANPKFHLITAHVVQNTSRVMRRRTVGVGV